MARRGLRLDLRSAFREAVEGRRRVERTNLSVELEDLATHFRTTAFEMIREAAHAEEGFVVATLPPELGLDDIAADLTAEHQALARDFLLFLRERERVDSRDRMS